MGLTPELTHRRLQETVSLFALQRDVPPAAVNAHLHDLADVTSPVILPRASAVRRAGRRRRRVHTLLASVAAVAAALGSGAIAYEPASAPSATGAARSTLRAPSSPAGAVSPPGTRVAPAGPAQPTMLDADQIDRLGIHQRWTVTSPSEVDIALDGQCRRSAFADPLPRAREARAFQAAGTPARVAVQRVEVSTSAQRARQAYATTLAWYAQCEMGRLQLVDSYQVAGVGDAAAALRFRLWSRPMTSYWVALTRVGPVTTSTVSSTAGGPPPPADQVAQSLADSVAMLCAAGGPVDDPSSCRTHPALHAVPPPTQPADRGLLTAVDLPPAGEVAQPWVGTTPTVPTDNPAATSCDRADFLGAGAVRARTRTFLTPGADLPTRFGLSETYGVFTSPADARRFMSGIVHRVDSCQVRELATTVHPGPDTPRPPAGTPAPAAQARTWRLDTAVTAHRTVSFRLGFVRVGAAVAELTFAPAAGADIPAPRFRDLVLRAGDRLRALDQ